VPAARLAAVSRPGAKAPEHTAAEAHDGGAPVPAANRLPELRYRFTDPELLPTALTHRSAAAEHNERLEFLGDAILNFLVAESLFQHLPDANEGELTRRRARLVKGETLAQLARDLNLGSHLRLGEGEAKSGGAARSSILADAFEALLGAVYLDGGLEATRRVVRQLYAGLLDEPPPSTALKDPKTQLQEHLQRNGRPLPRYRLVRTTGKEHQCRFEVECLVKGLEQSFIGSGTSRRRAEQAAAQRALRLLLPATS